MRLAIFLLALAQCNAQGIAQQGIPQGGAYEYEYYDPSTGASLGAASALPAASSSFSTSFSTPTYGSIASAPVGAFGSATFGTPALSTSTPFATPYATTGAAFSTGVAAPLSAYPTYATTGAPLSTGAAAPFYGSTVSAYPTTYGTAAVSAAPATSSAVSTAYGSAVSVQAQVGPNGAVTVNGVTAIPVGTSPDGRPIYRALGDVSGGAAQQQQLSPELQALQARAQRQSQVHNRNSRIVRRSSREQSQLTLYDSILSPGVRSRGFGLLRLQEQRKTLGALRSEARIASSNARVAYQRYLQEPSRINLLVSKYSDLNADLHDDAVSYNTINSATFGQNLKTSFALFGGASLSSLAVQIKERNSLQDTQRKMNRVAKQLAAEVRAQQAGAGSVAALQGSASQRLVAGAQYGPGSIVGPRF